MVRLIALIIFVLFSVALTILLIPVIKALYTPEGRELIKVKVENFRIFAPILYIFMHILHIVIAFIPGEPVEILGGVLFGTFYGLLLSIIGVLIGTVTVFYMVKKFGKPLVEAFVSEDKLNKFKILKDEKKLETLVFILFLIPGTPKDALTYFVPLTKISPKRYFLLATFARIPSIVSSTFVGASLGKGNLVVGIIIFALTGVIGLVGIYFNNKISNK